MLRIAVFSDTPLLTVHLPGGGCNEQRLDGFASESRTRCSLDCDQTESTSVRYNRIAGDNVLGSYP